MILTRNTSHIWLFNDDIELAIEAELEHAVVVVAPEKLGKAERIKDAPGRYIEFCKASVSHYKEWQVIRQSVHAIEVKLG